MLNLELTRQILHQQQREWLAAAEQERQIAAAYGPPATIARRIATPLGRALVRLGAGLLRYGRADTPAGTRPYRASARSIRLN